MALKAFYKTLDEIPEALREFYKQQADGRYKFDADDVEDVTGLKSALEHEREERRTYKGKYGEVQEAIGDLSTDELKALIADHKKGQRKKAIDEDKVEELIQAELEKRIGKMQETHAEELGTISKERDALKGRLEVVLIENALSSEASRAGALPDALPDIVRRGRERFYLEGDGVVAKDSEGNVLYGSDGKSIQTVGEFMDELKGGARHLFQPSKGGGAGKDYSGHSGAGQGNQTLRGVERMRAAHASDG